MNLAERAAVSDAEKRLAAALGREFDYHDAWPTNYMDRIARILREHGFQHAPQSGATAATWARS